jgi:hypothetical protein
VKVLPICAGMQNGQVSEHFQRRGLAAATTENRTEEQRRQTAVN